MQLRRRLVLRLAGAAIIGAIAVGTGACKKPEPRTRGVGDALKSFIVENCETRKQYCQVCAYAGKPILMAVGDVGDAGFEEDLARIQKLVDAHAAKELSAFAVVGVVRDGRLESIEDEEKAIAQLGAMKARLELKFPLTVLPKKFATGDLAHYAKFNDAYALGGSRMVLLANNESRVVFADVIRSPEAERQFRAIEEAIAKSL